MTLSNIDLRATFTVAVIGLALVAFPVYFHVSSDFINALSVFAPIIGGLAWTFTIVRKFGRGFISNTALMIVSPACYFALILATIVFSMSII